MLPLAQALQPFETGSGYGWLLLKSGLVLVAICLLAYLALRFVLPRYVKGLGATVDGQLEVVERLAIAPRRSLLVVRAGSRHLLVGSSEAGLQPLGELDGADWPSSTAADSEAPHGD